MSMAISNSKIIVNKPIAKTNNNTLKKTGNSDCFQSNLPDLKTYVQIERLDDSVIEACNKTKKLPENMKLVILPEIFKEGVYLHMGKDDPTAIYTPAQYKIYKDGESIPQNATILDKIPSNLKLV